jgi:hypothetical protein
MIMGSLATRFLVPKFGEEGVGGLKLSSMVSVVGRVSHGVYALLRSRINPSGIGVNVPGSTFRVRASRFLPFPSTPQL